MGVVFFLLVTFFQIGSRGTHFILKTFLTSVSCQGEGTEQAERSEAREEWPKSGRKSPKSSPRAAAGAPRAAQDRPLTGQAGGVEWPDSRSKGDSAMPRQHTNSLEIVGREAE
jgi:hypothetical protein